MGQSRGNTYAQMKAAMAANGEELTVDDSDDEACFMWLQFNHNKCLLS